MAPGMRADRQIRLTHSKKHFLPNHPLALGRPAVSSDAHGQPIEDLLSAFLIRFEGFPSYDKGSVAASLISHAQFGPVSGLLRKDGFRPVTDQLHERGHPQVIRSVHKIARHEA